MSSRCQLHFHSAHNVAGLSAMVGLAVALTVAPAQSGAAEDAKPFIAGVDQPRDAGFDPQTPAARAEQSRLDQFDKQQRKLDRRLDRKLTICRC